MTTTYVLAAIDMSGSMYSVTSDTVGGVNRYLTALANEQDANPDRQFRVTMLVFNDGYRVMCRNATPHTAPLLNEENYSAGGNTALLDAVGYLLFDAMPDIAEGDRALLFVATDGQENSSSRFTNEELTAEIDRRVKQGTLAVYYIGRGHQEWHERQARKMSGHTQTVNTGLSGANTRAAYDAMSVSTVEYSKGASAQTVGDMLRSAPGLGNDSADES